MSETIGEVFDDEGVLVVHKITVRYRLSGIEPEQREKAERAHRSHAKYCPVARSISPQIEIETHLEYV